MALTLERRISAKMCSSGGRFFENKKYSFWHYQVQKCILLEAQPFERTDFHFDPPVLISYVPIFVTVWQMKKHASAGGLMKSRKVFPKLRKNSGNCVHCATYFSGPRDFGADGSE